MLSDLLSPSYLREHYLPGLQLTGPTGMPLSDPVFLQRIRAMQARFERKYGISLVPLTVKLGPYAIEGEPAAVDVHFPGVDYHPDGKLDHQHFSFKLPLAPVREIVTFGLWLPGMSQAARFPIDWGYITPKSSTFRVYPGKSLTFAVPFLSGIFASIVDMGRPVPQAWHVVYRAGYTEAELTGKDADVLDALCKMIAIDLLVPGSLDANFAEGVSSRNISVDGLSQSMSLINGPQTLKYSGLILAYGQQLEDWEKTFWARRSGVKLGVL